MPKIAAIQMCSSASRDENLQNASELIAQAVDHGAELIVLPEMFSLMGIDLMDKIHVKEIYGAGPVQDFLSEHAARFHTWIVGGTIPIACNTPNKVKAACIVYNHVGQPVARYDKIHLFDVIVSETESYQESDSTEPGNELVVVDTPLGTLGLSVCYDIRFPGLFTQLCQQGAQIIAIPAAFTEKTGQAHWHVLTRARAIENVCYIVGACQGGLHANKRKTYGHSLIIEPWGSIVHVAGAHGTAIVYADIDLKKLNAIRATLPVIRHQRRDLY